MPKKHIKKQTPKLFASHKERLVLIFVGVVIFVTIGVLVVWLANASVEPTNTYISSITDLGEFTKPSNFSGRDGTHSALIGGKVTWIFGDTLYSPKGISKMTGDFWRSATAAIGNITNPTQVSEPLDSHNAPYQLIPYTAEQLAYNSAKSRGDDRYAIWPSSIAAVPDGSSAYIYFLTLLITPNKWISQGVGIATINPGSTIAQTKVNVLFGPTEPSYRKAIRVGETFYVYAECGQKLCPVSRVPISQATNRAAYTFWNGSTWVSDINQAKPVLPSSNLGSSVMYNKSLKSYVSANIPNYSHSIYFSYAPAPEGPWTTPIKAIDMPTDKQEYVPEFHPELSSDNDKTVFLSYAGTGTGVRLLKLSLNPPADGIATINPAGTTGATTTNNSSNQKVPQQRSSNPSSTTANTTTGSSPQTNTETGNTAGITPTNRLQNNAKSPEVQKNDQKPWWNQILDFFLNLFGGNN